MMKYLLIIIFSPILLINAYFFFQEKFTEGGTLVYSSGSSGITSLDLNSHERTLIYSDHTAGAQYYNVQLIDKNEIIFFEDILLEPHRVKHCYLDTKECSTLFEAYNPIFNEDRDSILYLKGDKNIISLGEYNLTFKEHREIQRLDLKPKWAFRKFILLNKDEILYPSLAGDLKILNINSKESKIIPNTQSYIPFTWRSLTEEIISYSQKDKVFYGTSLDGKTRLMDKLPPGKGFTYIEELDSIIYSERSMLGFGTYLYSFDKDKKFEVNDSGFTSGFWIPPENDKELNRKKGENNAQ